MTSKFDLQSFIKNFGFWVGLISGVLAIFELFVDTSKTFKIIYLVVASVFLAAFIWNAVNKFFSMQAAKKEINKSNNKKAKIYFGKMHKIFHELRNYKNQILYCDINSLNRSFLSNICVNICNLIEQFYRTLFSTDVGVCIKLIDTETIDNTDFGKWKLTTIARSSNHPVERGQSDEKECFINDKSDYYVIVSPKYKDTYFASKNLTNIKKDFLLKYKMEFKINRDNFLEYYKSTIVMPIRIERKYVSKSLKMSDSSTHHILGFLCIDSEKTFDNESSLFDVGIEVAKSFADSLYHLFENYLVRIIEKKSN